MIQRLKKKVSMLRADPHMREVGRGVIIAFVLKVGGSALTFGFNVAVARLLGADGAGLYFLALSVTAIGSIIGRVGLDQTLLRFIAIHASRGEWGRVKGVHVLGMRVAVLASALLSLMGFFAAGWMATWLFSKPELAEPLRWMSLCILPVAILNLQASSLLGLKRIRGAMLVQGIGVPLIALLLILPLANASGVEGVSWSYLAATSLVTLLSLWVWRDAMAGNAAPSLPYPLADLWASCKPLFAVALINGVLPWAPLLLLGIWVSAAEVGVFGAATRMAVLVSFLLVTLNTIVAPKFAELHAQDDMLAMGELARRTAGLLTLLVSPLFIILFIFSDRVMSLFGSEFALGGGVLVILMMGQFVNAATGSVGLMLMMSGNEKAVMNINIASVILLLVLLLLLAPTMGNIGAAIASAITLAINNLACVYAVYRRFGIITIPGGKRIFSRVTK